MRRIPRIHVVLFVLTFLSMLVGGALQNHMELIDKPVEFMRALLAEPAMLAEGLPFALTLMIILLSHELSHYFASRLHHTRASLPYFIPAPSIIGTFGAFIRMKSPITTRKALVDIGASGPIAGFVLSVAASVTGLMGSEYVSEAQNMSDLVFGTNLLFYWLAKLVMGTPPEGHEFMVNLHPVAVAGWIGLFVTSLNLIPIGQLDGGHIAYALFGSLHRRMGIALVAVLAVLGVFFWVGWGVWAVLMVILGVKHPPVVYWERPLDPRRRLAGWAALVIFVLTFTPVPFMLLS